MRTTLRRLLLLAFRAGFAVSAEGWNGEYAAPDTDIDRGVREAFDDWVRRGRPDDLEDRL